MRIIDIHAHLDLGGFNVEKVIEDSKKNGVVAIIANGVHVKSNREVLKFAEKYDIVKPALGFYPTHTTEVSEEEFDQELEFIKSKKPIAFGEIGLDLKEVSGNDNIKKMERAFEKFISLSEKTKIPMIVHSRKAEPRVIEMLESSRAKNFVMHCFSGKKALVKKIADKGWFFSVPVTVIRTQQFQELVEYTNINQLLTETDAPYLGPANEPNVPKNILLSIKKIAEIKGLNEEEVSNNIFMNYQRVFL
jgi:TatD DNase family protein